ncbi:MAG: hypothetical protein ACE5R6_01495 [Candidatus Heimdallarchaeota archaeon]
MYFTLSQIAKILATLLVPVPAIYITLRYFTGKIPRNYETFPFTDSVTVAEQGLILDEFSARYAPALVHPPELGEEPETCLFEVVEQDKNYIINYWFFWCDATHPNKLVDEIHRIIRQAYYGGKTTKDAKHVQVTVSKKTGHVVEVKFKTNPRNQPFDIFPKQTTAIIKRTETGDYSYLIGAIDQEATPIFVDSTRIKLAVQTWNHQFTLIKAGQPLEIPLLWLDAKLYKDHKIARRKGGRETLKDWIFTLTIISVIIIGWAILL